MPRNTNLAKQEPRSPRAATGAARARKKFLRLFPAGFRDATYLAWERDYKWTAHQRWVEALNTRAFRDLIRRRRFAEIAGHAVGIESRTNLLFSFEKMALRDAVRSTAGARLFAIALYEFLHGPRNAAAFERWCEALGELPRKQTRVLTWPLATVFGFLAKPTMHVFLKPKATRAAAAAYGFDFHYASRPSWDTYESLLDFTTAVRRDVRDLRPRDMIDIQSFIWVLGSDEYAD
jgi:hypothetical protein